MLPHVYDNSKMNIMDACAVVYCCCSSTECHNKVTAVVKSPQQCRYMVHLALHYCCQQAGSVTSGKGTSLSLSLSLFLPVGSRTHHSFSSLYVHSDNLTCSIIIPSSRSRCLLQRTCQSCLPFSFLLHLMLRSFFSRMLLWQFNSLVCSVCFLFIIT
jgi:hypothetical protein